MSDNIADGDIEEMSYEDIPEGATALQCGHVVAAGGVIGRIVEPRGEP